MFSTVNYIFLDSSTSWQILFQDSATPVMEGIINLHHDLMFLITFILFFVLVIMSRTLYFFRYNDSRSDFVSQSVTHGTTIEII
jgi:cytochrome c oxidase subunit 2